MTYALERNPERPYPSFVPTLGQNIRRFRKAAGYATQVKFAEAFGGTSQTISDLESNRADSVGIARLLRIAKFLKVTVEDLVDGVDADYDMMRRDLLGPEGTGLSDLPGGSDGSTSTGVLAERLSQRNARDKAFARDIQNALGRIVEIAGRLEQEAGEAAEDQPGHRRGSSKTG